MYLKIYFTLFIFIYNEILSVNIDPNGYILYCPCMGRFGNQADHFLGALGFAKGLNRTLALPPWVEYRYGEPQSLQIPFDTYFKVEPLMKYHRVITMEDFMENIAPELWPPDKRTVFCYMPRGNTEDCNAKEGNPFGPFWNHFNVDFVNSEFYGPLHYDVHHHDMKNKWTVKYKPYEWPVIAFIGAPGSFPVQQENRKLHKYLKWSDDIHKKAMDFITSDMPKRKFVGIHLRNGIDWVRACEHTAQSPNLFAAPQCVGYRNELGPVTKEMCFPSKETIIKQLKRTIRNSGDIKAVFVASDSNHMMQDLREALKRMEVTVHKLEIPNPHVDLAILGLAHHFIGNCISSFSAFAKRERDVHGLPSSFWAFPPEKSSLNSSRDEL